MSLNKQLYFSQHFNGRITHTRFATQRSFLLSWATAFSIYNCDH